MIKVSVGCLKCNTKYLKYPPDPTTSGSFEKLKVFLSPVTECSVRRPKAPHSSVSRNLVMAAAWPTGAASHLTVRLLGVEFSRIRAVGGSDSVAKVRDFSSEIVLKQSFLDVMAQNVKNYYIISDLRVSKTQTVLMVTVNSEAEGMLSTVKVLTTLSALCFTAISRFTGPPSVLTIIRRKARSLLWPGGTTQVTIAS